MSTRHIVELIISYKEKKYSAQKCGLLLQFLKTAKVNNRPFGEYSTNQFTMDESYIETVKHKLLEYESAGVKKRFKMSLVHMK
jgi:hypothetical protein